MLELEAKAKLAQDPVVKSEVLCRISIQLARQGDSAGALDKILSVRKHYGDELQHEVASWVMLAEGVLHFTKFELTQSYDRLRRAYGLAVALRNDSARPCCAAWMSSIEFNMGKYDDMISHIIEVFTFAAADDHQARSRACLVLADSLQVCDSFEEARRWYAKAHWHSTSEGDQTMLSAYLYNVAAFRTANLRLAHAFGEVSPSELKRASMEANSSFTYDMAVRNQSFTTFWKILHGQLLVIQGEYSEAKILLDSAESMKLDSHDRPLVLCDLALCNLRLGNTSIGDKQSISAEYNIKHLVEPDDLAFVLKRISQVRAASGNEQSAANLNIRANEYLAEHRGLQNSLRKKLQIFKE